MYYVDSFSSMLQVLIFFIFKAAYEAGALREAKGKLEKSLEDLTLRFILERRQRVCFDVI
jgi:hypothetical protein